MEAYHSLLNTQLTAIPIHQLTEQSPSRAMDSPSTPQTKNIKAAAESIVDEGTRLGPILSDFTTGLQELAPKETTVSTK
jgi:hypothetical protein